MSTSANFPTNYLDQMMSIEMVKNLCSGNGKGKEEIVKFLLIIGMDEFKRLFKAVVDKLITQFQTLNWSSLLPTALQPALTYLWIPLRWIFNKISALFSRNESANRDIDLLADRLNRLKISAYKTTLQTEAKFQQSFWDQIVSDSFKSQLSYTLVDIDHFDQIDNLTIVSHEIWSDIRVSLPEQHIFIEFKQDLDFTFSTRYNKKTLTSVLGRDSSELMFETWKPFSMDDFTEDNPMSPEEFRKNYGSRPYPNKVCTVTFERLIPCKRLSIELERIYQVVTAFLNEKNLSNQILSLIHFNCLENRECYTLISIPQDDNESSYDYATFRLQIDNPQTNWSRLILLYSIFIYEFIKVKGNISSLNNLAINNAILYPFTGSYYKRLFFGIPCYTTVCSYASQEKTSYPLLYAIGQKIRESPLFENETNWKRFINHLLHLSNYNPVYDLEKPTEPKDPKPSTKFTSVRIGSDHYTSPEELQKTFFNYLNTFSSNVNHSKKASKIKTFDIKIEHKEEQVSSPNPAYALHQKRIEELKKAPESESNSKILAELISTMPSETILVSKITKEVVCSPINEVYKDLTRLYLAKKDKQKLSAMLQDFRDDKELLLDLGLPNKLAILLYGEPGCGKSSTIETIGSYLQKDIYNLDLQSVQTKEDLSRLWDYVTNQTKNGGCIVMEDIDVQSDIVLARTLQSTNNHTIISTPNETPLSLSFFLNLIQGSCQRDGQVFITTTNWIEKLDPAFTREMRFDVKIEMKKSSIDQMIEMYSVYFPKRKIPLELIKQIPEFKYTPAMFIDCFRQYIKNPDFTDEELFSDFV